MEISSKKQPTRDLINLLPNFISHLSYNNSIMERVGISADRKSVSPAEAVALYIEFGWGTEKDYTKARMARSLKNCDVVVSARNGAGELIGISRSLTDGTFYFKILDMVIAPEYQRQ